MLKISFVGDINPGGVLTYTGGVSQEVIDLLAKADLRVGTLECAIGDGTTPCSIKMPSPLGGNIIYAPDESLSVLKKMNIDVVSLANNHACDLDESGLLHTMDVLDSIGIKHVGAGKNIKDASKPLIIEINEKKICFLAYLEQRIPCIRIATEKSAGANPLDIDSVVRDIKKYKSLYDHVIVLPHWGRENRIWPRYNVMQWCRKFVKAGADAVIGSHTHIAQPIINYKSIVVAPSLGNFLFPDRYIDVPRITVYPSEEQRIQKNIPVVYNYPFVKELTFKVVKGDARIGEILTLSENKEDKFFSSETYFTYLDESNYLQLRNMPSSFTKKYKKVKAIISNIYLYRVYLIYTKIVRNLK